MSVLAQKIAAETRHSQVSNISANARVDYLMRFSKQLVVVLDDDSDNYSHVSSEFLAKLNNGQNAAFISISNRLDNIQIRSRIIEQLFPNRLFDPELSLAVSLISFLKESPQEVCIALEHGQSLSLQVLYELTQFVEIAKKIKFDVKVLIAGDYETGRKLASNKALFNGKISVVSAESGHVLPLSSHLFKDKKLAFSIPMPGKVLSWTLAVVSVFVLAAYLLYQQNILTFNSSVVNVEPVVLPVKQVFVLPQVEKIEQASTRDIHSALFSVKPAVKKITIVKAEASDILSALLSNENMVIKSANATQESFPVSKVSPVSGVKSLLNKNDIELYKNNSTGFVIQYGLFINQPEITNKFLLEYAELPHISYFRVMNNKEYTVITSLPFASKLDAQEAMKQLPENLRAMNLWIKSVSLINIEIEQYQSSQL
jgi:DamX protein